MFYDLESKEFGAPCMSNGALNYPLFTLEPRVTMNPWLFTFIGIPGYSAAQGRACAYPSTILGQS